MQMNSGSATGKRGLAAIVLAGLVVMGTAGDAGAAVQRVSRPLARPVAQQSRDTYNRDVRVHNQTGWPMTYFYAARSGTDDWRGDLLGSGTLAPGNSVVVTVDDGSGACRYDFRAQFDNGEVLRRSGINVCQLADYYFTR